MTTWREYRAAVDANDGSASLRLARSMGVPDATWRTWKRRHGFVRIVNGAHALATPIASETLLRGHLDALWPDAVLGGRSALWAHGLSLKGRPWRTPRPLEVVADRELAHRPDAGVHLRRSRTMLAEDRTEVFGWPVTTVARTAMDLAHALDDEAARALVIDLIFHGLCTATDLVVRAELTPTAWGAARLKRVAAPLVEERSDSIFEWCVRRALEQAGLLLHPGPLIILTSTGPHEVDVAVPGARIAVECNGRSHRESEQMDRDAEKANALLDTGWLPLQTTWAKFHADTHAFVSLVTRNAARRRTA